MLRHRLGSSAPVLRLLDARQRTPTAPVLPVVRLFQRERTCLTYVCMRDLGMKGRERRHHWQVSYYTVRRSHRSRTDEFQTSTAAWRWGARNMKDMRLTSPLVSLRQRTNSILKYAP